MDSKIVHNDCAVVLPCLPDGCVDCTICDPPYGVNKADWDIPPSYEILAEILRVTKGPVLMFCGAAVVSQQHFLGLNPTPERVLIWHITFSPSMSSKNRMGYRYAPIMCWRLPKKQNILNSDIISESAVDYGTRVDVPHGHWTPKPIKLMKKLVDAFSKPGEMVMDPYCGTGTTCLAAHLLDRKYLGIDIKEKFVKAARERIQAVDDGDLLTGDDE